MREENAQILVTININCRSDNIQKRSAVLWVPGSPEGGFTRTQSFGEPMRAGAPGAPALSTAGQSPACSSKKKWVSFFSLVWFVSRRNCWDVDQSLCIWLENGWHLPHESGGRNQIWPRASPKANLPSSTLRTKAWTSPDLNLLINIVHSTGYDDFLLKRGEQ